MTFKNGKTLQIHRFIHAKLSGNHVNNIGRHEARAVPVPVPLLLPTYLNVSSRAGHAIVHYLYTGEIKLPSCVTAATAASPDAACGLESPAHAGEPFPAIGVLLELATSLDGFPALKSVVVGAQGILDNLALEQPAVAVLSGVRRVLLDSDLGHIRKAWLAEYIGRIVDELLPEELRDLFDTLTEDDGLANPSERLLMRAVLMRVSSGLPTTTEPAAARAVQCCPYPTTKIRSKVDKTSELVELALELVDRMHKTGDEDVVYKGIDLLADTLEHMRDLLPDVAELLAVVDEREASYTTTATLTFNDGKTLQVHNFILQKLRSTNRNDNGMAQSQPPTNFNFSSHTGRIVVNYLYTGDLKLPDCLFAQFETFLTADIDEIDKDSVCALVLRTIFEMSFCLSEFGTLKDVVSYGQAAISKIPANTAAAVARLSRLAFSNFDVTSLTQKNQLNEYIRGVIAGLPPAEVRALAVLLVAQPAGSVSMLVEQMLLHTVLEARISGKVTTADPRSVTVKGSAGTELGVPANPAQPTGRKRLPKHCR